MDSHGTDHATSPPVRRILVVEDDVRGARLLEAILAELGGRIHVAPNAIAALDLLAESDFDLITIDLGLPDLSGIALLHHVRELTSAPVVMVTADDQTRSLVEAFEAGADDYVVKPVRPMELLARARAVVRRATGSAQYPDRYADGVIVIDFRRSQVSTPTGEANLSGTERRLLMGLVANAGRVMTHDELLQSVWGAGYEGSEANLQVFIGYLRRKVEPDPHKPRYIRTYRGVGYEFVPQDGGGQHGGG